MGSDLSLTAAYDTKIYRQLLAEHEYCKLREFDEKKIYTQLLRRQQYLYHAYSSLSKNFTCPKVRFGRTEINIPILTCGGMRMQQTWTPEEGLTLEQINQECQNNFEKVVDYCMQVGINHFETARGYGIRITICTNSSKISKKFIYFTNESTT
jgi:hypothetical protein